MNRIDVAQSGLISIDYIDQPMFLAHQCIAHLFALVYIMFQIGLSMFVIDAVYHALSS